MADVLNGHNGHAAAPPLALVPPPGPQDPEPDVITGVVIPPPIPMTCPPRSATALPVVPDPLRRENIRGTVTYWAGLHWHLDPLPRPALPRGTSPCSCSTPDAARTG